MKKIMFILAIASLALAQNPPIPGGAINGIPIDSAAFKAPNPCTVLKGRIRDAAKQQASTSLGISVTQDDITKVMAEHPNTIDPAAELKRITYHAAPIVAAWSAVYDDHRDPNQVYAQILEPKGITPEEWRVTLPKGQDPQFRKDYAEQLNWTTDTVRQKIERSLEVSARFMAMAKKLDEAVDQLIAKNDPAFRAALNNWNASARVVAGQIQHSGPFADQQYMEAQRAAWWKAQEAKVTVTLNDPNLAGRCGLAVR